MKEQLEKEYTVFAPGSKSLNLLDEDQVLGYLAKNRFDRIIHCATHNATRNSEKDLAKILDNNLRMFFNLVKGKNYYGRMLYFGSGAEYDRRYYKPRMKEEYFGKHIPADDYGFSKYIMSTCIDTADNIVCLRLFGVFGKYEDWEIRFISNAICKTLFDIDVTIKQNVFFDYLYINDLVKILKKLLKKRNLKYHHYNVCRGEITDLKSLAKLALLISGKKLDIKIVRKGFKKEYSGDNRRLMDEIGRFSFTPLHQAVSELFSWYKENKRKLDRNLLLTDK